MDPTAAPSAAATAVADVASQTTDILVELLVRQENVYIMAAAWSILSVIKRVMPKVHGHAWYVRLAPTYPLVLCLAFVWIPGAQPAGMAPFSKFLVGCILGGATGYLHKVWSQTIRGKDSRIRGEKRRASDHNPGE
jgi:hypothetical protein